ncbi:hypothetical protein WH47_01390 [Habropoda laboriosa]|uniref:Uncharacterized protein n=1 Tax=Habropoda laboriosa TaxID=597456 RepID=A0A0L7QK22_9HYME|nr:PREDICTED: uncharacterized protein LOC108578126 [Habropoda laboriosa]KOC58866.1 hypothetical protein WH47_01390 [Habropoda laboriosa]
MTPEDDAWAQTLITVTPEDDATLREISDTVTLSSTQDTSLILDPDQIVYRRSFTHRQFLDSKETEEDDEGKVEEEEESQQKVEEPEEISKQDAESQTYLQGTPTVHISVEYRYGIDESSQTMYMSTPCPPLKYFKDIMTSMNEGPMPNLKYSNVAATIISFHPDTSQSVVIEQLSMDVTEEEREEFESKLSSEEETQMDVTEILYFVIARAFWINDPTSQVPVETLDEATETYIKYNNRTQTFIIDNDTQTDLSCEPKQSNTMLLTEYLEIKKMILDCIELCISRGIETIIVVDDIINEIIDKCAERIRYPMKEQMIQTIATYRLRGEKEEDVLRKLRLEQIVDPLEASIIVLPLVNDLLQYSSDVVSKNAVIVVTIILDRILQRTMAIIIKLMELQKQSEPKPINQILEKRKKKILDLMSKKETETISTQTSIAGISEVKKMKKSKEVLCSVCRRQSLCQWCLNDQETETGPQEEMKILRTEDILLAYKPCYIVTKVSEKDKNLEKPCAEIKVKSPSRPPVCSEVDSCRASSNTLHILLHAERNIEPEESFNEWSYVTDDILMKPCSIRESISSSSQTTISFLDQSIRQDTSGRHKTLTSKAANALQILKETFCNQENCATSLLQTSKENEETHTKLTCGTCLSINTMNNKLFKQETLCAQQSCNDLSKLHLPNTCTCSNNASSHIPMKSHGDGFKIIPIYLSQNSNT